MSNPKAFVILGAVLPQFADYAVRHVPAQMFILGTVAATARSRMNCICGLI